MQRWDGKAVRAFAPVAVTLAVAFAATLAPLDGALASRGSPALAWLRWLPHLALAVSVVGGVWVGLRLWRARDGRALVCDCGGLLGPARRTWWGWVVRSCPRCQRAWRLR